MSSKTEAVYRRALDLAMQGYSEAKTRTVLKHEFQHYRALDIADCLDEALAYVFHGVSAAEREKKASEAYNKRAARKAKVMLSINYDKYDLPASVSDAITDLSHLCEQQGFDFEELLQRGRGHFHAEIAGEQE